MSQWLISVMIVVVCLPSLALGQAYKCQSPKGSISFQQSPCPDGTTGSTIKLAPAPDRSAKEVKQPLGNPPSAQRPSGPAGYPYARGDDVKRLRAENAELQATMARMKKDNPDWRHSQSLTRLNAQAEALNASIQSEKK
jgi:hypothetical protein